MLRYNTVMNRVGESWTRRGAHATQEYLEKDTTGKNITIGPKKEQAITYVVPRSKAKDPLSDI